jgi:hypothetical protein
MTRKEFKFTIAQHYKISESDVDDSLLPIFWSLIKNENAISEKMEENKKSVETVLAEYSKNNEQLIQKIKGTITTHNYVGASWRTAFMVRWGWGIWVIILLILSPGFVWVYNEYLDKGMKYKALEKIIIYDPTTKQYYIDSKDYWVQNNKNLKGIVIQIEK